MGQLTNQELKVLVSILGLILLGLAVKYYRAAHPPEPPPVTAPAH